MRLWPFGKRVPAVLQPVADLLVDAEEPDPLFCPRPLVEKRIAAALKSGHNLVVYGPPRQGKTTLLNRCLGDARTVTIDCRPQLGRSQIYRVLLASLGYSVLVSSKRRGKVSTTVKVNAFGNEFGAGAEGESERVTQAVAVDLKNPSEVAYLVSRLGRSTPFVLNNFHLLDDKTQQSLLFDLVGFAERACVRFVIVGAWPNADHLEDIEPALSGKLKVVEVPLWSADELGALYALHRAQAAADASAPPTVPTSAAPTAPPTLAEALALANGDVSLFRALLEMAAGPPAAGSATCQDIVVARYGRGMANSLRALLAQRDAALSYQAVSLTRAYTRNDDFDQADTPPLAQAKKTTTDVRTGRPFSDGASVRLDADGKPEYFEVLNGELATWQVDLIGFVVRQLHAAVQRGVDSLTLDELAAALRATLPPAPLDIDAAKLNAVWLQFFEAQRRALVVPPLLVPGSSGRELRIADRRLFLFLSSTTVDDLDDLLEECAPDKPPRPRRRSSLTPPLSKTEAEACVARAVQAAVAADAAEASPPPAAAG